MAFHCDSSQRSNLMITSLFGLLSREMLALPAQKLCVYDESVLFLSVKVVSPLDLRVCAY